MSGPATPADTAQLDAGVSDVPRPACVEVTDSRHDDVGGVPVRRALPRRGRRTVGAWCFVDHMGPTVDPATALDVGPHPHIGLQTVTWLLDGELLHRDSLGSEQPIRPGQLNLMTAGHGIAHSEESVRARPGRLHGVQLWVAQPASTRHGPAGFEHHAELPQMEFPACVATVFVGSLGGVSSPARRDTVHVGAELALRPGSTTLPIESSHEYALVLTDGAVAIDGRRVRPGQLAYLGVGRDELRLDVDTATTAILVGGEPFPEQVKMWWNYVARTTDEITAAHQDWTGRAPRFAPVATALAPIDVGPPPWAARPS